MRLQEEKEIVDSLIEAALSAGLFVISVYIKIYIFSIFWLWFIYPLHLFGEVMISPAQALGVFVFFSILKSSDSNKTEENFVVKLKDQAMNMVAFPLLLFVFGYIVHSFM